jgi:hypothetical protein
LNEQPPETVTGEEDCILTVFLNADHSWITKELSEASGVNNVSRVMKQLARKFPGAVRTPGREGKSRGYYVRVQPAPALK